MGRRMSEKSVKLEVRIWFEEDTGRIHLEGRLAGRHMFISTVNADPASKRGHPNLFGKLARCLREAGAPAPDATSD